MEPELPLAGAHLVSFPINVEESNHWDYSRAHKHWSIELIDNGLPEGDEELCETQSLKQSSEHQEYMAIGWVVTINNAFDRVR
eukprot:CAMPEP_0170486030 /NCGR_PEP_ID=MMETSP0208-20121228/5146_1 /TAXON_ID=197538 /ORGANISM="Strombidium inclinatum, Strain S3" /LENGTH=82 /DNA_ID=CAMNT_0010759861 /DNA_START=2524 /DNA_END=2771 /DNA_ORIENTATION=-